MVRNRRQNEKGPQPKLEAFGFAPQPEGTRRTVGREVLVHAVHTAAVAAAGLSSLLLRNLDDECFGG